MKDLLKEENQKYNEYDDCGCLLYDVTQNEDNKIDYNYVFLHGESNIDYLKQGEDAENFLTNNLVLGTHSFTREDNKTSLL